MNDGTTTERGLVHGLRHRSTGAMLRVREVVTLLQDEPYRNEQTSYHLTLDEDCPVFDAGSPEVLANALLARSGSCERYPDPAGFTIADVEPVMVETVVTRTLRPLSLELVESVPVRGGMTWDLRRALANQLPDLAPFLDALPDHAEEMCEGNPPGSDHGWDSPHLIVVAVKQPPSEMRELAGRIVDFGGGCHRRAVGAVELPRSHDHLMVVRKGEVVDQASFLVCLQDARPVPEAYLDAVADRGSAPTP